MSPSSALRLAAALVALLAGWSLAPARSRAEGFEVQKAPPACRGRDLREVIVQKDPAMAADLDRKAAAMPFGKGRLFRISKPGVPDSWLFGTIHVNDPRVTTFPPAATAALDKARTVALELAETERLEDPALMQSVMSHVLAAMVARPGERADALVPPADVQRLEKAMVAQGQPAVGARTFRPVFMATVLAVPACAKTSFRGAPFVDLMVARKARERGVPLVGLETLAGQLDMLAATPSSMQGPFLRALLASLDLQEDVYETTIRRYAAGEFGWLVAWSRGDKVIPGVEAKVPDAFFAALIDTRNAGMRDAALPLLAEGGVFIGVGAAHIPGEAGLANLIRQAGYAVERAD
ncbi:MAG: TraB/GumN family protein [Alsobacter sp.]